MGVLRHLPVRAAIVLRPATVLRAGKYAFAGMVALQTATVAGLLTYDYYKKRGRRSRSGFPQPGVHTSQVGPNQLTIHTYGADLYDDMIAEIDKAEKYVYLETYLWKSDEVGQRFKDALERAADRGVEVKVIFDGLGNMVVKPWFYRFSDKVEAYRFPVIRPKILATPISESGVTHRKIMVADGHVGFIGGYNIGSLYATEWRDTHVKIEGPDIWELHESFEGLWNRVSSRKHTEVERMPAKEAWDAHIRSIDNLPVSRVYPIRAMYLEAINKADDHIYLTTAYFIPDKTLLDSLIRAAARGVDVRILIPKDSNHILADFVSRGYWRRLLDADITVLLYENAMIHAKTMTIDGQWSTIGTANVDRLSLGFNYEINLEITDADVARDLEHIYEIDAGNSHQLTRQEWEQRHYLARFAEFVLAPLAPFL